MTCMLKYGFHKKIVDKILKNKKQYSWIDIKSDINDEYL